MPSLLWQLTSVEINHGLQNDSLHDRTGGPDQCNRWETERRGASFIPLADRYGI
jgi:hypothetical protein